MKINENLWTSMKIYENLWKSVKINTNLWKAMKIDENQSKSMKINMKIDENLWTSMKVDRKSINTNEHPWTSMKSYPRSRDPQALKTPRGRPEPRSPLQTQQSDNEMWWNLAPPFFANLQIRMKIVKSMKIDENRWKQMKTDEQ